ncbi:MAG: excisionase family DNA-binding protein [Flavobacteriales bacterium]
MKNNLFFISISEDELSKMISNSLKRELANLYIEDKVNSNELISRTEVSKLLKISLPTITEWVKNGKIPAYRIGSRVLFNKEEVLNSLTKIQTT